MDRVVQIQQYKELVKQAQEARASAKAQEGIQLGRLDALTAQLSDAVGTPDWDKLPEAIEQAAAEAAATLEELQAALSEVS